MVVVKMEMRRSLRKKGSSAVTEFRIRLEMALNPINQPLSIGIRPKMALFHLN
jgi:hypothetical protein